MRRNVLRRRIDPYHSFDIFLNLFNKVPFEDSEDFALPFIFERQDFNWAFGLVSAFRTETRYAPDDELMIITLVISLVAGYSLWSCKVRYSNKSFSNA